MAYADHAGRAHYANHAGSYLDVSTTDIPQVSSFSPHRGPGGSTRILVYFSTLYDLMTGNEPVCFLMFGTRKCGAALTKLDALNGLCQYVVATDVPSFASTGWAASQVPVFLMLEDATEGSILHKVDVGNFTYTDGLPSAATQLEASTERRMSYARDGQLMRPAPKRETDDQIRTRDEYSAHSYPSAETSQFYTGMQHNNGYAMTPQYSRTSSGYSTQGAQRPMYQYPNSAPASPPIQRIQSPSMWYGQVNTQRLSPSSIESASSSRPTLSALPAPHNANPPLIRTSTLQQTPSPGGTPAGHSAGYGTYNIYNHSKAQLLIQGDLDSMADQWTAGEWDSKRRIVLFRRSQSGSKITTSFKPIGPDARPPNSICISCIWWQEKKECFVTSVDTIFLLEQLVAARFTVEEKNRIRRNLEGFRPLTVSKGKADSEDFFKVIMAFPNPKPRNIEKDVKVFPWKILSGALKKIIGKYVSLYGHLLSYGKLLTERSLHLRRQRFHLLLLS